MPERTCRFIPSLPPRILPRKLMKILQLVTRTLLPACFCFPLFLPANSGLVLAQDTDTPAPQWFKGNLHTHSLWSDGNDFPENIIHWYKEHDYDFLALTEHNRIAEGERWMSLKDIQKRSHGKAMDRLEANFGTDWAVTRGDQEQGTIEVRLRTLAECREKLEVPGQFLMVQAEEITDSVGKRPVHMNVTNVRELILPAGGRSVREAVANNLRAVSEQRKKTGQPMIVHLNHPNFGWGVTADDLAFVTDEQYFEVYNGHPSIRHLGDETHPGVEKIWDIVNTLRIKKYGGRPLLGLGTDDSHHYYGQGDSRNGRGWIYVRSTDLHGDAIVEAIEKGDFYASSGVELADLQYDPQSKTMRYEIAAKPDVTYEVALIATPKSVALPESGANTDPVAYSALLQQVPEIGQVIQVTNETAGEFTCQDDWLFARIVITSSEDPVDPSFKGQKQQAWLQPFGFVDATE